MIEANNASNKAKPTPNSVYITVSASEASKATPKKTGYSYCVGTTSTAFRLSTEVVSKSFTCCATSSALSTFSTNTSTAVAITLPSVNTHTIEDGSTTSADVVERICRSVSVEAF